MIIKDNLNVYPIGKGPLKFHLFESGDIQYVSYHHHIINSYKGSFSEGGLLNLYLRIVRNDEVFYTKLIGIDSPSQMEYNENCIHYFGEFNNVNYDLKIKIDDDCWFFEVNVEFIDDFEITLFYGFDVGLANFFVNPAYNSQYIDHHVIENENGYTVLSKQNQGAPLLLQHGTLQKNDGYSTDGFQFFGINYKFDNIPKAIKNGQLDNLVYQYELSYICLQSPVFKKSSNFVFYGFLRDNYNIFPPCAEEKENIELIFNQIIEKDYLKSIKERLLININTVYCSKKMDEEIVKQIYPNRQNEEIIDGKLMSFFTDDSKHVIMQTKEALIERPHGNILIDNGFKMIDDCQYAVTNYIFGVFASHIVLGNTNFNQLSTENATPLNILKSSGLRIMVLYNSSYRLLTMPALYELGINSSKWYYLIDDDYLIIETAMAYDEKVLKIKVESAKKREYDLLILNYFNNDMEVETQDNGFNAIIRETTLAHSKYPSLAYQGEIKSNHLQILDSSVLDSSFQTHEALLIFKVKGDLEITIKGTLNGHFSNYNKSIELMKEDYLNNFKNNLNYFNLEKTNGNLNKLNNIFIWYAHNALIHYSSPHGLEQFSGAAWGTRDVCQGPFEFFMSLQKFDIARSILTNIYSRQFLHNGDWPQWFMFDRFQNIQAEDSHGDIIIWPLRSLAVYLLTTNDYSILKEELPYFDFHKGQKTHETYSLFDHIIKQLKVVEDSFITGTYLSSYGGGDWDDTLQPKNREQKKTMTSGWTIALTLETINLFIKVMKNTEYDIGFIDQMYNNMYMDYRRYIIKDGIPAGFACFNDDKIKYLLHPLDKQTGIKYRLLPLTRGIIAELFTKSEAEQYLEIIKKNLLFPDGAHLMSSAVTYKGGKNDFFMRAETAANFGREISLQYVHAHLRYLEAMMVLGKNEEAEEALFVVNPINIKQVVPNALPRQSNAYFSSSDGNFHNRYEANDHYDLLRNGLKEVKGGWRIYSSGPGLYIHKMLTRFLGIDYYNNHLLIDPILTKKADGMILNYKFLGKILKIKYNVANNQARIDKIILNGKEILGKRIDNSYRKGGILIPLSLLDEYNEIELYLR